MRCSKCGGDNREGRKFCAQCGAAMAAKCARCGAPNEPGEKFCGDCGAPLTSSSSEALSTATAGAAIRVGWAMAQHGRNEEGIAQIQEGLAASRATGAELRRVYFLTLLA